MQPYEAKRLPERSPLPVAAAHLWAGGGLFCGQPRNGKTVPAKLASRKACDILTRASDNLSRLQRLQRCDHLVHDLHAR
jgi:hypothetical protein